MEKAQESNKDILPTNISPEPVSQLALSECVAHSNLLPKIILPPQNNSTENSSNPTTRRQNLFAEPGTEDTELVDGISPNNSNNTTTDHAEDLKEVNPLPDLTGSQQQQQKIKDIHNIDNPLDINTLHNCVTIHGIGNQHDHIICSALVDTGSPVTLLSEKMQHQLNLPATPLKSHCHLVWATDDALTTLRTFSGRYSLGQ